MIEVKELDKCYGQKPIFQQLDLKFEKNKSYALIGASGSGKSTLLNMLARLEKPTKGTVLLNGKFIWALKEKEYFRDVLGYIFQNYALVENETVRQNLSMVEKNQQKQVETLNKVGLGEDFLKAKIYELSGGQAQRVAITRMILKSPSIILADEPTGALDEETSEEIIHLLLSLVNEKTVLIFATHNPMVYRAVDEVIDVTRFQVNEKEKEQ